jgi:serine phosphatase RsbU (regulator of sigma subunit)
MSLLGHLNTLESAGLVRIAQLEPDLEYLFRHALVREAAYTSILSVDQRKLHQAVGEAIELLYPERLNEFAAMLSYHFGEAGDTQKALKYCTLAGEASLAAYANPEAETQFRCALGLVQGDPERAILLYLLGEALYRQSRYDETLQAWHQSIQLNQKLGEESEVARLYARSARAAWHGGDQPEGLRLSQEGLQAIEGMADTPSKAMLIHEAARAYHFNGFPEEAEPFCRQALEMAERLNAVAIQADALTTLGVLPNVPPDEALRASELAVELAESNSLLEIATRATHNLGVITAELRGDQKAAREHYLHAAEIAHQRGSAKEEVYSLQSAAGVSMGLGDLKTGEIIIKRINEISSTISDPTQILLELETIEFGLLLLKGELDAALENLRRTRLDARQRGDLQMLANFCNNLADTYVIKDHIGKVDDWSEAEEAAKEGIEISGRGVGSPSGSRCQLGTIYVRQGRLEEANQLYKEARQMAGSSPNYWEQHSLLGLERDLAAAEGRWEAAISAAEKASQHLAQVEMRFPWAFALILWAEIHQARGEAIDLERARAVYREAMAIFQEMEAEVYINLIEARLRALVAKSHAVSQAHEAVAQELVQAGRIQEGLLPKETPDITGWETAAVLHPARATSGDFYDFIPLPGSHLGLLVADVADKGMGAALYMATFRTLIRTYAGEHPAEPELALAKANRRILAETHGGLFTTLFYGVLDPSSGKMIYCNAGHNPPFFFSTGDNPSHKALTRTGMPLGITEEASWEQGEIKFKSGDILVAYTDGVTEAQNDRDEFYDEDRLLKITSANLGNLAKDLIEVLEKDLREFAGKMPQLDDMTLMIVKKGKQ